MLQSIFGLIFEGSRLHYFGEQYYLLGIFSRTLCVRVFASSHPSATLFFFKFPSLTSSREDSMPCLFFLLFLCVFRRPLLHAEPTTPPPPPPRQHAHLPPSKELRYKHRRSFQAIARPLFLVSPNICHSKLLAPPRLERRLCFRPPRRPLLHSPGDEAALSLLGIG